MPAVDLRRSGGNLICRGDFVLAFTLALDDEVCPGLARLGPRRRCAAVVPLSACRVGTTIYRRGKLDVDRHERDSQSESASDHRRRYADLPARQLGDSERADANHDEIGKPPSGICT